MNRGDERAALRAEAKYRRIDVKPEKNIYDYGPNDPVKSNQTQSTTTSNP